MNRKLGKNYDSGALWEAIKAFGTHIYEPRHRQATNETNTKLFLIAPFLHDVLGIDTGLPENAAWEVSFQGFKGGAVDLVLQLRKRSWCVVEMKKLGALSDGSKEPLWSQLAFYAGVPSFHDVNYFALTDGRFWKWYYREPAKLLPKKPFLIHDVTEPSIEILTWCLAVRDYLGGVGDLESASKKVLFTVALKKWLKSLRSPADQTLDSLLGDPIFSGLSGRVKRDRVEARDALHSVWPNVYADHLGEELPTNKGGSIEDDPPPPPPRGYAWRLGKKASWNSCKNGTELMMAVIQALAARYPAGADDWYRSLAQKKPNWVIEAGAPPPLKGWTSKQLSTRYSVNVSLSAKDKDRRLRYLAKDIGKRTGMDPQLQIQWPEIRTRKLSCEWRLGANSTWNISPTGATLMVAVTKALAAKSPDGAAEWYRSLAMKQPTWIMEAGALPQGWTGRDLGEGYVVHVGLSNKVKHQHLRYFAEDIRTRTGIDPQLEIRWQPVGEP